MTDIVTDFAGACAAGDALGVAAVKFLVKRENAVISHSQAMLAAAGPAVPESARLVLLAICACAKQVDDAALATGAVDSIGRADAATLAVVPLKCACRPQACPSPHARPRALRARAPARVRAPACPRARLRSSSRSLLPRGCLPSGAQGPCTSCARLCRPSCGCGPRARRSSWRRWAACWRPSCRPAG